MAYQNKNEFGEPKGAFRTRRRFMIGGVEITKPGAKAGKKTDVNLGTFNEAEAGKYEDAIDSMAGQGRADIIRKVLAGKMTAAEVYRIHSTGTVSNTANIDHEYEPLIDALNAWVVTAKSANGELLAPATRMEYAKDIRQLARFTPTGATVGDLVAVYNAYRDDLIARGKGRSVKSMKDMLRSYVRSTQGLKTQSDLYKRLVIQEAAKVKRDKDRKPLQVWEVHAILDKLPSRWRNVAWAMCTLGMGGQEYRNGFTVMDDRVIVHGSKNENREDRPVPKVSEYVKEFLPVGYQQLNKALKDAGGVTSYDMRACYTVWVKEAGIPDYRGNRYIGWTTKTVADGYRTVDLAHYLNADAKLLAAYLQANWEPPKPDTAPKVELFTPKF